MSAMQKKNHNFNLCSLLSGKFNGAVGEDGF